MANCNLCGLQMTPKEVSYGTGICNNCFDASNAQTICIHCSAPLTAVERSWKTGMCDTCYKHRKAHKDKQLKSQALTHVKKCMGDKCAECKYVCPDETRATGLCNACRDGKILQSIPSLRQTRTLSLEDAAFCISTGTLPPDSQFPDNIYGRVHCYRNDVTFEKIAAGTILPNDRPTTFVLGPSGLETCVGKRFDALIAAGLSKEHVISQVKKNRRFGMLLFETQPNQQPISADWSGVWAVCKFHYPSVWNLLKTHSVYLETVPWSELTKRFKETVTHGLQYGLSPSAAYLCSKNTALDARMWLAYEIYCSEAYTGNGWTADDNGRKQLREYFVNNLPLSKVKNWTWVELPVSLSEASSTPVPSTWSMQKSNCELVPLDPSSSEYTNIVSRIHQTTQVKVIKIERVQNVMLWQNYCNEKEQMRQWNGRDPQELRLFHGTSSASPDCIYASQTGFDMRFCSSGMWGVAVYFAVNAAYSRSYSYTLPSSQKQFFFASVLVGDTHQMPPTSTLRMPPLKTARHRYDSVKGNTGGSDVYMVYSNGRAYPEYLVTFQ